MPALVEPTATTPGTYMIRHIYYSDSTDDRPKTMTVTVTDNGGLSSETSEILQPQVQNQPSFSAECAEDHVRHGHDHARQPSWAYVGGQFVPSTDERVGQPRRRHPDRRVWTAGGNFTTTFATGALVAGGPTPSPSPSPATPASCRRRRSTAADGQPGGLTITANGTSKTYGTTETFAGTAFTQAGLVTPTATRSAA